MLPERCSPVRHQRGIGLIVVFLLASLAVMSYLLVEFNTSGDRTARNEIAGSDMLAAKEALLAYNLAQENNKPCAPDKMSLGRLPLPDMGRRGISDPDLSKDYEGVTSSASLPTGTGGDSKLLMGRLPWKTLGIRPLRDEQGECLWYGLSPDWKDTKNDVPAADPNRCKSPPANAGSTGPARYLPPNYNWDSLGDFDLYGTDLQKISTNPHLNRAVAIVVSPGPPLAGQNRATASGAVQAASGEYVVKCGGNYDALNYLDPPALATATASTGGRFNAFTTQVASTHVDFSGDPAGRNAMSGSPPVLPKNVLAQPIATQSSGAKVVITNDQVVPITNDEIFTRLLTQTHSTSVTAKINETLLQLKTCLQAPNPAGELPSTGLTISGSKKVGKLDPTITCASAVELDRWRDNIWYAMIPKANAPTKINCTGPCASTCDGVLVFAGTRTSAQRRSDNTEKGLAANYLEAGLGLLTNSATLDITAPTTFGLTGNSPGTDIATCLTHPIPTSYTVNVGDLTDRVATNAASQTLLLRDTFANTITLGNSAAASGSFSSASAVGCTWSASSQPFGTGLRVYFTFRYNYYDPATTSVGPGFTFALTDAAKNGSDVCGGSKPILYGDSGQLMGYAGVMKDSSGTVISTIAPPKMAIEFDTARNPPPDRNDTTTSHIAAVYWGVRDINGDSVIDETDADDDNKHATPTTPQLDTQRDPVNDSALGYACLRDPLDANCGGLPVTSRVYHVRIDIVRDYDGNYPDLPSSPTVKLGRSSYYTRVWINQTKLTDMDNLNSDFKDFPTSPTPDLENRDQSVPLDGTKDLSYIYNTVAGLEAFQNLRFGFTVAQPTRREEVVISNLAVKPR